MVGAPISVSADQAQPFAGPGTGNAQQYSDQQYSDPVNKFTPPAYSIYATPNATISILLPYNGGAPPPGSATTPSIGSKSQPTTPYPGGATYPGSYPNMTNPPNSTTFSAPPTISHQYAPTYPPTYPNMSNPQNPTPPPTSTPGATYHQNSTYAPPSGPSYHQGSTYPPTSNPYPPPTQYSESSYHQGSTYPPTYPENSSYPTTSSAPYPPSSNPSPFPTYPPTSNPYQPSPYPPSTQTPSTFPQPCPPQGYPPHLAHSAPSGYPHVTSGPSPAPSTNYHQQPPRPAGIYPPPSY